MSKLTSLFHVLHRTNFTLEDAKASCCKRMHWQYAKVLTCLLHLEATEYLQENGVIFAPGKAANAGGVATSALGDVSEQRTSELDIRRSRC